VLAFNKGLVFVPKKIKLRF